MEDNLNFALGNLGTDFQYATLFEPNKMKCGRQTLFFLKMEDQLIFKKGSKPHLLEMEDDLKTITQHNTGDHKYIGKVIKKNQP